MKRAGKVTVVGAGFYGSTTALRLAEYDIFETVVITDIVEGKPEVAKELVSGFEVKTKNKNNKQQKTIPNIDFDKFIKDLDRVERLWNEYLEIEDEDLLVLL